MSKTGSTWKKRSSRMTNEAEPSDPFRVFLQFVSEAIETTLVLQCCKRGFFNRTRNSCACYQNFISLTHFRSLLLWMFKGSFIYLQTSAWYITVLVYYPLSSFQLIKEYSLNLNFQGNRSYYHFVTKFRKPRSKQNLKTCEFSNEKTQLSKKCTFMCFLRLVEFQNQSYT